MKAIGNTLCLLAAISCSAAAEQPLPDRSWEFTVFYGEREIGRHVFTLHREGGGARIDVQADFEVSFLFMTVYSYRHANSEIWQDGCLRSIDSTTDDNGTGYSVRGRSNGESFIIETGDGIRDAAGCIRTFAYWDLDFISGDRLLNPQTGELMPVSITDLGSASIPVRGSATAARHYRLDAGEFSIELWYSREDRNWLALRSTTSKGAVLDYRLL